MSQNNTPMRAYIYGIKYPLKRYSGTVIAYGKSVNGQEFIVVADKKTVAYDVNILPSISKYEEKGFSISYAYEKSCGAIIFRKDDNEIKFLLVRQRLSNSWSFPKGHIMLGESEHQTARREVFEEVGIKTSFYPDFRIEQYYHIKPNIVKKVIIFLSKFSGEIKIDNNEIINYLWVDEKSVPKYLHKKDAMYVIKRAKNYIIKNNI